MEARKILLVTADETFSLHVRSMLEEVGYDQIISASSYVGALEALVHDSPGCVITDLAIQGNKSGLDLIQWIQQKHPLPCLIVSSIYSNEWLAKVAEIHTDAFLVNPVSPLNIAIALEMACKRFTNAPWQASSEVTNALSIKSDSFFIKESGAYLRIDVNHIQYIESHENYVKIYQQTKAPITIRSTMKEIIGLLPAMDFVRISRSHIVRIAIIDKISQGAVCLSGIKLPIGKTYKEQLFSTLGIREGGYIA